MAIKLSALYKSNNKKDMKLIAGKNGINNIVSWTHMIESIETSIFLDGQELAFTTGIALEKIDLNEELYALVKHTYKHNASGIVINIGPYIEEIPDKIIQFCDDNNFPLFEVPWHSHIANLMKDFCYQITLSDKTSLELSSALNNAIFFPSQHELYIPYLESQGFRTIWPYCITLIEIFEQDGITSVNNKKRIKILEFIKNILYSYDRTIIYDVDAKITFVFANYTQDEIKNIVDEIKNRCMEILKNNEKIYLCIGENTKNIECIVKSARQAMDTLKIQRKKGLYNKVSMHRDLGVYKLLLGIEDKEIIKKFYNETIAELIKNDELKGTDYVTVLESYLRNSGSIKAVSEELFFHKNTVCYKLSKIEGIIGCNISPLDNRIIYSLALMLKDIM
jgi:hypothetical protein